MILRLTFTEQTTKFPAHSALLKQQQKMFDCRAQARKYLLKLYKHEIGMLFTLASLQHFVSCYEHERYPQRFLLSFIQHFLCLPIFCCMFCGSINFGRLTKTFQFLKMIHSGYSISYFNLFLIYAITCYSPVAGESNSQGFFLALVFINIVFS